MADPVIDQFKDMKSFFSLRGDLDGERQEEYSDFEQLIGLNVDQEEFLLPISEISEILILSTITYVPRAPKYIEGVINLRGIIIPTINLRKMAGHSRGRNTQNTRIIVVKHVNMFFGLIVDGITYVQSLAPNDIAHQSLPFKDSNIDVITRIAKKDDQICGILDIGKIVEIAADGKLLTVDEDE